MIITLTPKRKKFSASHSLACFGPDHLCARLHGHTWWVQATFAGAPASNGILIDYEVMDRVVAPLDHQILDALFAPLLATGENILAWLVSRFATEAKKAANSDCRCTCQLVRVELLEDPVPGDGHVLVWEAMELRCRPASLRGAVYARAAAGRVQR